MAHAPYKATPHAPSAPVSVYRTPDARTRYQPEFVPEHEWPVRFVPAWRENENTERIMAERPRMRIT